MNDRYVVTIDECIKEKGYEEFTQGNLLNAIISNVTFLSSNERLERKRERENEDDVISLLFALRKEGVTLRQK